VTTATTVDSKYGELKNGDKIFLQGYLFEVTNIRLADTYNIDNPKVVRFEGRCTSDERNDSIRNTGYNGGTYGAYPWVKCTIVS